MTRKITLTIIFICLAIAAADQRPEGGYRESVAVASAQ